VEGYEYLPDDKIITINEAKWSGMLECVFYKDLPHCFPMFDLLDSEPTKRNLRDIVRFSKKARVNLERWKTSNREGDSSY